MGIEVDVLGDLRITVGDAVVHPPAQVASLLVALAIPDGPIRKMDLAREVLYLSPASIDSRLSRLHRLLGLDAPLHRVPMPRSGLVELDRSSIQVDVDRFRSLAAKADSLTAAGLDGDAADAVRHADRLWRAPPFSWDALGDPHARTPFGRARDELVRQRRHVRELAARLGLQLGADRDANRIVHGTAAIAGVSPGADGYHHIDVIHREAWNGQRPCDMRLLHKGTLTVGGEGILIGHVECGAVPVDLAPGQWSIEVWIHHDDLAGRTIVVVGDPSRGCGRPDTTPDVARPDGDNTIRAGISPAAGKNPAQTAPW